VIRLCPEAETQVDRLIAHYEAKGRIAASVNLLDALERAKQRISANPQAGMEAPRPSLKRPGKRWITEGRYWISYSVKPPVISGVFYVASDIPNRI
jgi:plasmid stabilization system protein ParE